MTSRRRFIIALAALGSVPRVVQAQRRTYRIAFITRVARQDSDPFFRALMRGLERAGYVEGRNLATTQFQFDSRAGPASTVAEIIKWRADVIVSLMPAVLDVSKRISNVPIVFGFSGDPVKAGLVNSLARPGRNLTGMAFMAMDLVGKRLELLREFSPKARHLAVIANPRHPGETGELDTSRKAAAALNFDVSYYPVANTAQVKSALASIPTHGVDCAVVFPDSFMMAHRDLLAEELARTKVPAISGWSEFADAGMLMTYGPNLQDSFQRLAGYVDRVLQGASPMDLPVELPSTIELVVNQRTASRIGMRFSEPMMLRANRIVG